MHHMVTERLWVSLHHANYRNDFGSSSRLIVGSGVIRSYSHFLGRKRWIHLACLGPTAL